MEKDNFLKRLEKLIEEGKSLMGRAPSIRDIEPLEIDLELHMDHKKWRLSVLNLLRINLGINHPFHKSFSDAKCTWVRWSSPENKNVHHFSYTNDSIAEGCAVLTYIKEQVEEDQIENIEYLYGANLLSNFLDQAQILCNNKYFEAAAIYGRLIIENHINEIIKKHGIIIEAKKMPPKLEKLRKENIIDLPTERLIQSLYDIGTFATHNKEAFSPYKNKTKLTDFLTMIRTKVLSVN